MMLMVGVLESFLENRQVAGLFDFRRLHAGRINLLVLIVTPNCYGIFANIVPHCK